MTHRQIIDHRIRLFDVIGRRKKSHFGVASADDFKLKEVGELPLDSVNEIGIPYCIDLDHNQIIYTAFDDPREILSATFLYQAQYKQARQVAIVPLPLLDQLVHGSFSPIFIFSPGRCGSTLLAKLLTVSGLPTISEPDLMTQIAQVSKSGAAHPLLEMGLRACLASFATHYGDRPAIKLRSQCNSIVPAILRGFPGASFIVILRERVSWARSRYRAFGGDPKGLAQIYSGALRARDRLLAAGKKPLQIWYENLNGNPIEVLEKLSAAGLPVKQPGLDAIAKVMQADSQYGTRLASSGLRSRELSDMELEAFEDECDRLHPNIG